MNSQEYIQQALRTESINSHQDPILSDRVEHAIFGMVTESGELLDVIKKSKYYQKPVDRARLIEEVGDVMWYLAVFADAMGISFEEMWEKNLAKLKVRYPEKFNETKALNRNLDAEHSVFGQ